MIGRQIAALRHARGLTQEQLAERAQVSVDVIRRLEQGQRNTARFATLQAIAAALGTEAAIRFTDRTRTAPTLPDDTGKDVNSRDRRAESTDMNLRPVLAPLRADPHIRNLDHEIVQLAAR